MKWFLNSEIYDRSSGAYRIFYSKREKGPIYPEITAYAINLACILYKEKGNDKFLQRAKDCAEYLLKLSKDGLSGHSDNIKYLFDTGIFISALFDLYDITKIEKYINGAHSRLEWLCSYFDGEKFPSITDHTDSKEWHKVSSVHLAKLAIPLSKGWQELNEKKYKSIAKNLLDWTIKFQNDGGRFRINQINDNTRLHPHCYATEGFLFASQYEKLYWRVAKKAGDWLAKVQNKDGSFYQWLPRYPAEILKDKLSPPKCTDATSQAIRIWKVLGEYKENIRQAENFLESMKVDSGLVSGKKKLWFIEVKEKEICPWSTFFYIHSKLMKFGDRSRVSEIF